MGKMVGGRNNDEGMRKSAHRGRGKKHQMLVGKASSGIIYTSITQSIWSLRHRGGA